MSLSLSLRDKRSPHEDGRLISGATVAVCCCGIIKIHICWWTVVIRSPQSSLWKWESWWCCIGNQWLFFPSPSLYRFFGFYPDLQVGLFLLDFFFHFFYLYINLFSRLFLFLFVNIHKDLTKNFCGYLVSCDNIEHLI